jgi:hypothetical protein
MWSGWSISCGARGGARIGSCPWRARPARQ